MGILNTGTAPSRGELDFADEGFDGGFAFGDGAAVHDLGQVFADAGSGGGVVHGAVLERRVVTVECGLAGGDLGGEGGEFRIAVPDRGLAVCLERCAWTRLIMSVRTASVLAENS
ncbi:hypothetical protein [Mangrovihabitans endophyticus]|uniref:hypothetical protein n=1 Tax=Mangrovihabitans endophyticus TaxID=1751298 RepID=UPI001664CC14|nr:hypothetical protein [Mangrovihabitans endophyticus]